MKNVVIFLCLLFANILALPQIKQFRIVGGGIAQPHQFPYQVGVKLIRQQKGIEYNSWCGGSLISNRIVLTAAHCMDNTIRVHLYFATHNRWESNEPGRIIVEVGKENFIVHQNYSQKFLYNDIALIKMPKQIELNDNIKIINLPRRSHIDFEGQLAVASGWGKAGYKIGSSDVLRFVYMQILNNKQCEIHGTLRSTQLCSDGTGPKSACESDSGGPFVVEEFKKNKLYKTLVGIISFGAASCEKGYPTVYTRVSSYLDWIHSKTGIKINN